MDPATAGRLQEALDLAVVRHSLPGLQASVRTAGGETWSGASGTADLKRKLPVRTDHLMRIGSATKMFTAAVILRLQEEGRLSLEDPLSVWFPDFPHSQEVTVRQLLNHSSGIAEFREDFPALLKTALIPTLNWGPDAIVALAARRGSYFAPGSAFQYSNTNYLLLGLIAERVTGRPLAELVRQTALAPAGLRNTFFLPQERVPDRILPGYDRDLMPFDSEHAPDNTAWASLQFASGNMVATADDLALFLEALFGGRILALETVREMTNFLDIRNERYPEWTGYGLGIERLEIGGQECWGHMGLNIGFESIPLHCPERGHTIVVLGNVSSYDIVDVFGQLQVNLEQSSAVLP